MFQAGKARERKEGEATEELLNPEVLLWSTYVETSQYDLLYLEVFVCL